MTATDYPDYATSQDHANKIATTGAPLLGFKNVLAQSAVGQSIPANSTVTLLNPATIDQIGYEIALSLSTAAGTATPVQVDVVWFDGVTGLVTEAQNWGMFAGTAAAPHIVRITGPSNGDQIEVTITSQANVFTVKYSIMQTSRVYTSHFGRTITPSFSVPSFPGFTYASGEASSNILCNQSQSVVASGSNSFLLPLYSGTARMWGRASDGTGGNNDWRITYSASLVAVGDALPYIVLGNQGFSPDGQGSSEIELVALARVQHLLQLVNHNASTANTMIAHLIAQEIQS